MKLLITVAALFFLSTSCNQNNTQNEQVSTEKPDETVKTVTTAEEQLARTPDEILQRLKEGNERFMQNNITRRDHSSQVRLAASGQFPKSVILSCLDSRIPVEDVFDKGIGDMFVARNAGSLINEDIMGSLEYACAVAGAKLIVVMGHSGCGAVNSAIKDVQVGNITAMLAKIKPAVKISREQAGKERNEESAGFKDMVGQNNVRNSIDSILSKSPMLKEMSVTGKIKIVGAYYDIQSGKVNFL